MRGISYVVMSLAGLLMILFGPFVLAQTAERLEVYEAMATIPTNIDGIKTFVAPPIDFDPLAASDDDLARYGFPPRPQPDSDPVRYNTWTRTVSGAKVHWGGSLKVGNRISKPAETTLRSAAAATSGTPTLQASSWSAIVNTNKLTKWNAKTSIAQVEALISVPTVHQPFGLSCGQFDGQALLGVGIDGITNAGAFSGDILEGGIFGYNDWAHLPGGTFCFTGYRAWFEWYPTYSMVETFAVNAGDTIEVAVWNTSPTSGFVWINDETQQVYSSYSLTATVAPFLIGNTAEYFVGSTIIGNAPSLLTNYTDAFFANASAIDFNHLNSGESANYYPGMTTASTYLIDQIENPNSQVVSFPTQEGKYGIMFQVEGCAYSGGCTTP